MSEFVDYSTDGPPLSDDLLSTGIEVLDRKLGGGIPPGRIIALTAKPASQSELFLYEMAAVRDTVYLTTERTISDVETSLSDNDIDLSAITIHSLHSDDSVSDAYEVLDELGEESMLIIDPVDPLEVRAADEYRTFLNAVKTRLRDTESLGLIHCLDGGTDADQRSRTEYLADVIFELRTRHRGGSTENSLFVPKFRGGAARTEAIALDLSTNVTIDVSRKIA